jgi:N-acetylmuramoyl-L-alanine amidase
MASQISGIAVVMTQRVFSSTARAAGPLLAAFVAAVLAACGGPPKQPGFDRLYRGLSESLPRIDPSVLAGRRILLDPGHGGRFRGTVGRDSLEESGVNLGCAKRAPTFTSRVPSTAIS